MSAEQRDHPALSGGPAISMLRWIIYQMASEMSKYVPEVRTKYLRRCLLGHVNLHKNLVASIPQLLALIVALMHDGRPLFIPQTVGRICTRRPSRMHRYGGKSDQKTRRRYSQKHRHRQRHPVREILQPPAHE